MPASALNSHPPDRVSGCFPAGGRRFSRAMPAVTPPTGRRIYRNAIMDSARWDGFRPRSDDIVIATSYKAGTTWLQGICACLVFQAPEPPVPQDELTPWLDAVFSGPIDEVLAQLDGLSNRRYIKTHLPFDGLPYHPQVKYVFVGRDGRDVFMSLWNHWNNMSPEFVAALNDAPDRPGPPFPPPPDDIRAAFDDWLSTGTFPWERDGYPFWSHLAHARTWWDQRHRENVLHVHFADLLADLDGEMRRISAFLDIPVDEGRWPALVEAVRFDAMKAKAGKLAPGATKGVWKDTKNFFHKGTNRRWEGVLTAEQAARYERIAAERLDPALARWLAHGRRQAGDPKRA
jgi:aryl sulfotransferase